MTTTQTLESLGTFVRLRRAELKLSLKELAALVRKEDGKGVSAQYLHDIEYDRRTPGDRVLDQLAAALGVSAAHLGAIAGRCPPAVLSWLKREPKDAPAIEAFFAELEAQRIAIVDWKALARHVVGA